jgi:hypothetical protein
LQRALETMATHASQIIVGVDVMMDNGEGAGNRREHR